MAKAIDASESTLRRDLEHLHQQGVIKRTHGGAIYLGDGLTLPALEERSGSQVEEKRAIGRAAAELIEDGDAILLDGGTTTLEVARLEEIAGLLLAHGLRPYQLTVDQAHRRDITSADEPLDFGIGTIFVEDPDGNTVEFLQRDRGITAEILGSTA